MVVWLWVGGLIMAMGTGLALVPNRRRRALPEREPVSLTDAEPPELVEAST
jgi:hypothetical protein